MEESNMKEEWRVYKDSRIDSLGRRCAVGALYEVSNLGRVKKNGKIIDCRLNSKGYYYSGISSVHRMVATCFIGTIPKGYQVDHIDGNPKNNNATNLRVVTRIENMNNPITLKRLSDSSLGKKKSTSHRKNVSLGLKKYYLDENNRTKKGYNKGSHREYKADGSWKMVKNIPN